MGAPAPQQQQQPQQRRGKLGAGQMGPPPPRQQMGPPPPPPATQGKFREYMQNNGGEIGDALMAMGANMLAQGPSDMPVGFGTMLGQGAQAGLNEYQKSLTRKTKAEDRADKKEQEEILRKRATTTFGQQQKDRLRNQGRQDVQDEQAAKTFANNQTRFGREGTAYDQANVMFDLGLEDKAEERRRGNVTWAQGMTEWQQGQDDRAKLQEAKDRITPEVFASMTPEQQKLAQYALQSGDASAIQPLFQQVFGDDAADAPKTSSTYNDARRIAEAQLGPNATEDEIDKATADRMLEWKNKPQRVQTDKSIEYAQKSSDEYVQNYADNAATSRSNMQMLDNLEFASKGVNTGFFGDLLHDSTAALQQAAKVAGLDDVYDAGYIDNLFSTNTSRAELMTAISNKMTLNATKLLAGQISEKELQFSYETVPNINNTPLGNQMIIDVMRAENQHTIDRDMFINSLRNPKTGALPGSIRTEVDKWEENNALRVEDKEGNITAYGQMLVDNGYITRDEKGWKDED